MNIVVATDFAYVNGGASNIALGSAKGLAARGHQVILFSAVGPVAEDLQDVPGLSHVCLDQIDVWRDPNRLRAAARSVWNQAAARHLAEVLAPLDATRTIVHVHSWTKALSSAVVRVAASRGFQVVITLHDFFSVCPNGTFFHYRKGQRCHLRPLSVACVTSNCDANSYGHKLWRVGRQIVQRSLGLPPPGGDFVSVSAASEPILKKFLPPGSRLHQVQNFTEMPRSERVPVDRNNSLIYIGRLSAEKGPHLLAECARRLSAPVVFVGAGPSETAVRKQCPWAEVTGWLSAVEVRDRLRAARALVFPSLWFETQGLVVAEAAAMGVPSIVPDTSAARDWVTHGVTGLWFKGGNINDLCRQVARVMAEPACAAQMGQAAYRTFWSAPPTLDRHVRRLEDVYGSILAGRNGA
ncbi:MAG: glycosyltransferase [Luteitalea sp.]|nr:glycosyltransferase [Luteitalea sp.]